MFQVLLITQLVKTGILLHRSGKNILKSDSFDKFFSIKQGMSMLSSYYELVAFKINPTNIFILILSQTVLLF